MGYLLIITFLFTAIIYLFFPIVFIIIGKRYIQSRLILIAVLNGLIVYFMFYLSGLGVADQLPNFNAAVIWSFVSYFIMDKFISMPKYAHDAEKFTKSSMVSNCSEKRFSISAISLGVLVSLLFWLNVRQGFGSASMEANYSNSLSEAQTESYEKGFEEGYGAGYEEAHSDSDSEYQSGYDEGYTDARIELLKNFVLEKNYEICWWDFSGMYHRDVRCSYIDGIENVVPALKSEMEESGIKPCFQCYK
uniref:Uncharacterized protein n=1 Tax=Podoviridae sp. ctZ5d16 TaxID=2825257 RepID=A0A8S5Q9L4_9CAUD|nr:MAG TPA: hypothetical protein [Podoviridae sp. ctZ5d16]